MTRCGDVRDLFSSYVEGELTDDARRRFEEHIDRCSACSENLAAVRLVIEAGQEVATLEPPRDLEGRQPRAPGGWIFSSAPSTTRSSRRPYSGSSHTLRAASDAGERGTTFP